MDLAPDHEIETEDLVTSMIGESGLYFPPLIRPTRIGAKSINPILDITSFYKPAPNYLDSCGDSLFVSALSRPPLGERFSDFMATLETLPSFTGPFFSGQAMQQLESIYLQLKLIEESRCLWAILDGTLPVDNPESESEIDLSGERNQSRIVPNERLSALHALFLKSLWHLLHRVTTLVKRSFFRSVPRFRGLAWSGRPWCLLHGARPPRLATLPA
jgi:hypothetical protein